MQQNAQSFYEKDLISEIISRNSPNTWVKDFQLAKLQLKTEMKDIMTDLAIIEAQVKVNMSNQDTHQNKKQLKSPCVQWWSWMGWLL